MKSRSFNVLIVFALLISLLGSAITVTPARAASIVVNSNADNTITDGVCTLREAITNANNDTASYPDCPAGNLADTITFAADYTITLSSQLPAVTTTMTITGNGEANTIIQASTCNPVTLPGECMPATYRVLRVATTSGNLTLSGLTVQHGRCAGACETLGNIGAGILNQGVMAITNVTISGNRAALGGGGMASSNSLTLTNVTFSGNLAGGNGGGINNTSSLSLTNVTFSGNQATTSGGGMYNTGSSSHTLTNVTFSGNQATNGGGMYNTGSNSHTLTNITFNSNSASTNGGGIYNNSTGTLTITNSTFSNNLAASAASLGGGIYTQSGTLNITNNTFSGNSAPNGGGGILISSGTLNITNSTFSGNSANSNEGGGLSKLSGTATILNSTFAGNSSANDGGNLASYSGTTTLKNTIIANRTGGTSECLSNSGTLTADNTNIDTDGSCDNAVQKTSVELNLDSLANNGGATQTIALLTGSHAVDTGDATTCTNIGNKDQRGVTRPQGAGCDIGAYETGAVIPVVTASNPSAGATLTSLSSITVVFNQDMLDNATTDGAENINNYILIEQGTNGSFDTTSCNGGVVSDDVQQTISTASYNSAGFITTLTLASPLTTGTYLLFICGTTSIWSAAGLELNNGASDTTVNFSISGGTTTTTSSTTNTSASVLPTTGFAPNKVTPLAAQPATLEYAKLGDLVLEIPSLNIKSTIVGVPQNKDKTWDVTWLGDNTGWLNGTAFPTWNGNSVLTAHVTNASGLEGPFAELKTLKHGDQIIVHMGGVKYVYEVRETKLSRPYATNYAFESKTDAAYLTLITCQGYNPLNETYLFRRLVRAVLIEVK